MTGKSRILKTLLLPGLIAALAIIVAVGGGQPAQEAEAAPTQLTVGLDMKTTQTGAGTYNINSLPAFESCVDVSTSVSTGIFYVDLFVLNASNLIAYQADMTFDTGHIQVLESLVGGTVSETPKLLGASTNIVNLSESVVPPVIDGTFNAGALDTSNSPHSGHGVLARLKLQGFAPSAGGNVINYNLEINPALDDGVTLTDLAGNHPGDTTGADGLFDGPFINQSGTIALNRPDGDSDGFSNDCDNCPTTSNAAQTNTDGDSQGDACDSDDDNDGIADGSDNCPLVYNPTQDPAACLDSDGDTILDGNDNCPSIANTNQANNDNDSEGDVCDTDDDNDGILDVSDNCVFAANPGQENWDADALGDACEDSDGDGWLDSVDNCKGLANPSQTNSDSPNDGFGDSCDNCPTVSNATQADFDSDFVGDHCDDSDLDGGMDFNELFSGTNPNLKCAATTAQNDEPVDAQLTDMNDNRGSNVIDVITYIPHLNTISPDPNYGARWDLDANNRVNLLDVIKFIPVLNTTCTP